MKAIVLAGGGGTRLWPLSRENFPKQFLKFGSGPSLIQTTVSRLNQAPFIEEIVVATNAHHLALVQEQLSALDSSKKIHILVEPARKNTAPAIALSVRFLEEFCGATPAEPILVLPSDHLINPESIFFDALEQMGRAAKDKWMITFGIRPTRPETGYGYIQIGQKQGASAFQVKNFVEKPNLENARKYLADSHFYWNSGMFLFSSSTFWRQLQLHAPDIYILSASSYGRLIECFNDMPSVSIDYAVMEKSRDILLCPLSVQWSDVGSWDSVYEMMEKDRNQNVKVGQVIDIDTKNSLIISSKRLISTIGLQDVVIVETEDAIFISKKGETQQVKALVQQLLQRKS
jgi:mannose-1-phosphate guanylyltransferase/mannose-6-phosphate isomerase